MPSLLEHIFSTFMKKVLARMQVWAMGICKIIICGSIGVGKSLVLKQLRTDYRGCYLLELTYSNQLPDQVTNMTAFSAYLDQAKCLLAEDSSSKIVIAEHDLTQVFLFKVFQ